MNWMFFALLAYLLFAGCNVMDKLLVSRKKVSPLGVLLVMNVVYAVVFLIIPFVNFQIPTLPHLLLLLLTGVVLLSSIIPYYKALTLDEVSRVAPIWQLAPVFILLISSLTIGENLVLKHYFGFAFLILGGVLISTKKIKDIFRFGKPFYLMILATVLIAVYTVMLKYFTGFYNTASLLVWIRAGTFLLMGGLLLNKYHRKEFVDTFKNLDSGWPVLVANVLLGLVAIALIYYAFSLHSVSIVSALGGLSPFFILVLASFLSFKFPKILKEELGGKVLAYKLIAIFLMLLGLLLVYN